MAFDFILREYPRPALKTLKGKISRSAMEVGVPKSHIRRVATRSDLLNRTKGARVLWAVPGKYRPKMIRLCDWTLKTIVIIVL